MDLEESDTFNDPHILKLNYIEEKEEESMKFIKSMADKQGVYSAHFTNEKEE